MSDIVLAGLFAAAAAYTKNEGVLFALLLGCLFLLSLQKRFYGIVVYFVTFFLCYALWFYWSRILFDFGSHATAGLDLGANVFQRAMHRFPAAVDAIVYMWCDIRQWSVVGGAMALALGWTLFKGDRQEGGRFCLLLPVGLLGGYIVIILFHTAEVYWQVGTAWNRLTVQVIPLFIVLLVPMHWSLLRRE